MFGEWIMEGVVLEREGLVVGRNLVDDGEDSHKHTVRPLLAVVELGRRSCDAEGAALHYD